MNWQSFELLQLDFQGYSLKIFQKKVPRKPVKIISQNSFGARLQKRTVVFTQVGKWYRSSLNNCLMQKHGVTKAAV